MENFRRFLEVFAAIEKRLIIKKILTKKLRYRLPVGFVMSCKNSGKNLKELGSSANSSSGKQLDVIIKI